MREIKFRVWEEDLKRMQDWGWIKESGYVPGDKNITGYIFMQYTGLKDKNGKEIYEGDFLHHEPLYPNIPIEVFWSNKFAGWRGKIQGLLVINIIKILAECEVIGNIYQNPELLKVASGQTKN